MRDNSRTYTLTTPAGTLTIGPAETLLRLVNIEWNAQLDPAMSRRSGAHGAYFDPAFKAAGLATIEIEIDPKRAASPADVEAARTALVAGLNALLDSGAGTLGWTNYGAATPLELREVWLFADPVFKVADGVWRVQAVLASAKPYAEDATATIVDSIPLTAGGGGFSIPLTVPFTLTASGGGSLDVEHVGDFPRAYPVLQVYGPAIDPHVINQTTDQRIVFDGSIAAGEMWELALDRPRVLLDGVTPVRVVDASRSTWFTVGRGTSTLQLACGGFTDQTKLRALMRSTWA